MPFSTDLPDPLVPVDTDLTEFGGFLLDVEHLLASELVAVGTPEECWAALMLWCRAWKQVPAGSLPNDERMLASFSGTGRRWPKVREVALHGFVLCSDGRLYHRFLCAEVKRTRAKQEAYRAERKRVAEWRAKQREGRSGTQPVRVQNGADHGTVPDPYMLTGTGTGTGTEGKKEPNGSSLPNLPIDPIGSISLNADASRARKRLIEKDFEDFWAIYPRKVAKKGARQKYEIARRSASAEEILAGAKRYADAATGKDREHIKHPDSWLHNGRWQDEEAPEAPMHRVPDEPPPPLEDC